MEKFLMGNEAIALGALDAGVGFVSGYPGTPSTEVLETVAKHNDGSVYVEWSVNEKSAMEAASPTTPAPSPRRPSRIPAPLPCSPSCPCLTLPLPRRPMRWYLRPLNCLKSTARP